MSGLYDEDTGVPTDEFLEQTQAEQDGLDLEEAHAFSALKKSDAWRRIKEEFIDVVDNIKEALIRETREHTIIRLQAKAQAYQEMLGLVEQKFLEAEEFNHRPKTE
jgi:hypothetical protein